MHREREEGKSVEDVRDGNRKGKRKRQLLKLKTK